MVYLVLSRDKLSKRQLVRTTRERRGEGREGGWVLGTWNALSQARSADPDEIELSSITSSKRLIFVRHGESTWNYVFNRYDRATPPLHRKAARPILTRPHGSIGR